MTTDRLTVSRLIDAPVTRVFAAWTRPELLRTWWGPAGVSCIGAAVDLRVGGAYRLGNRFADGREVWISGTFEEIDEPTLLVYSWQVDAGAVERVTVRFAARGTQTEITIVHERIADTAIRRSHELGWIGCLDGLARHIDAAR